MDLCGSDLFSDDDHGLEIVDINKLQDFLFANEAIDEEIDLFNMTSLSSFVLLNNHNNAVSTDYTEEDTNLQRLSLAYERLHTIPKLLLEELAPSIKILDISNNEFDNLYFLSHFKQLTSLICDHNNISSMAVLPYLPKLELLWLNHCKIASVYPWILHLYQSCPNLRYLSLMGNAVVPCLSVDNLYEYLQYRLFVISLFPRLVHLDDKIVTEDQRKEARRLYNRPLVERLATKSILPNYLKQVSEYFSTPPTFIGPERNLII